MSSTEQDAFIHLVPLVEVALDVGQQSHILTMAATDKIRLYVPVPPAKAVYAGSSKLHVSTSMTPTMQQKVAEAKRKRKPVISNLTPNPDIDYLALTPSDARHLLAARSAHVHWFPGGLKIASNEAARQQGGLEFVPAPLCLCPEEATVDRVPLILEAPEHAIRVEWRDVLLDHQEAALAADPNYIFPSKVAPGTAQIVSDQKGYGHQLTFDPVEDVPKDDQGLPPPMNTDRGLEDFFQLQSRSPGVFVLYAAAKHFYGSDHLVSASQKKVESWLRDASNPIVKWAVSRSGSYWKLANRSNVTLAYKLIRTKHNEHQGEQADGAAKLLNAGTVRKALKKYRPEGKGFDHISRRLSVVMLAIDVWERLNETATPPKSTASALEEHRLQLISELGCELASWGFGYDDEREAVIDFVIWPSTLLTARSKRKRAFEKALQEKDKLRIA